MPAPKTERKSSSEFTAADKASKAAGETNDCTVKALMIIAGVSYDEAHAALAAEGRKNKKGASKVIQEAALKKLGFKVSRKWHTREIKSHLINKYPGVHKELKNATTHHPERFPEPWADLGPAMVYTSGHVSAFKDRKIHDWAEGKAKRIRVIYFIEPLGEEDAQPSGLTEKEEVIMKAISCAFNYSNSADEIEDNATATDIAELSAKTGMGLATVKGVVGSLFVKDMLTEIEGGEAGKLKLIHVTEVGIEKHYELMAA